MLNRRRALALAATFVASASCGGGASSAPAPAAATPTAASTRAASPAPAISAPTPTPTATATATATSTPTSTPTSTSTSTSTTGAGGGGELKDAAAPELAGHPIGAKPRVKLSLASLKGKVVVVHFWATWCAPCAKSFPALQALGDKYKPQGVAVVGVSVDDEPSAIAAYGAKNGAKFPLIWDEGRKIADRWKPSTMPSTYVIDRTGMVRSVHQGYSDGDDKLLDDEVKKLL